MKALVSMLIAVGVLALGCGNSGTNADGTPTKAMTAMESGPAYKVVMGDRYGAAKAPVAVVETPADRGKRSYGTYCASCHGATGGGDGPLSDTLDPRPARHSDGNYMNSIPDEQIFKTIQLGGAAVGKSAAMAAWGGSLSDDQIRDVVAYVRTLANPPYKP